MKRIKLIIFIVSIAGAIFFGCITNTYCFFTSSATSEDNAFKCGNLKVLLDAGDGKNINLDYGKIGAGDSISKEFYIKNSGSLPFISKMSISSKENNIYDYLLCEINLYYERPDSNGENYKYTLYSGELNKLQTPIQIKYMKDNFKPVISKLIPDETLRCEIVLIMPEDVILPEDVIRYNNTEEKEKFISVEISATQVNNTQF